MPEKIIQYKFEMDDKDTLAKINLLLEAFNKLDISSKLIDKDIATLGKSFQTLSSSILPTFRRAFDEVVKSQQTFIKTEKDKIQVLQDLGKQAQDTGKIVREALTFSGAGFGAAIKASIGSLAGILPSLLGGALGAQIGAKVNVDTTGIKDKIEAIKPVIEIQYLIHEKELAETLVDLVRGPTQQIVEEIKRQLQEAAQTLPPIPTKELKSAIGFDQPSIDERLEKLGKGLQSSIMDMTEGGIEDGAEKAKAEISKIFNDAATEGAKGGFGFAAHEAKEEMTKSVRDAVVEGYAQGLSKEQTFQKLEMETRRAEEIRQIGGKIGVNYPPDLALYHTYLNIKEKEVLANKEINTHRERDVYGRMYDTLKVSVDAANKVNVSLRLANGLWEKIVVDSKVVNEELLKQVHSVLELNRLKMAITPSMPPTPSAALGGFTPPETGTAMGQGQSFQQTREKIEMEKRRAELKANMENITPFVKRKAQDQSSLLTTGLTTWVDLSKQMVYSWQEIRRVAADRGSWEGLGVIFTHLEETSGKISATLINCLATNQEIIKDEEVVNEELLKQVHSVLELNRLKMAITPGMPPTPSAALGGFTPPETGTAMGAGLGALIPPEAFDDIVDYAIKSFKAINEAMSSIGADELAIKYYNQLKDVFKKVWEKIRTEEGNKGWQEDFGIPIEKIRNALNVGLTAAIVKVGQSFKSVFSEVGVYLRDALQSIRGFINNTARRILPLGSMLAGVFSAYGAQRLAKSFINTAAAAEETQKRLGLLFKDLNTGKQVFEDMVSYSLRTGVALDQLTQSAEKLAVIAKGNPQVVEKMVKGAADIAATTGMSVEAATESIIRMWEGGSNASREFKNNGVLSMLGFQRGVELPIKETRDKLLTAFDNAAFKGNAEKMANSWAGIMGKLSNLWTIFQEDIMKSGVFSWLSAALGVVSDKIVGLKNDTKTWGETTHSIAGSIIDVIKVLSRAVAVLQTGWRALHIAGLMVKEAFVGFAMAVSKIFEGVVNVISEAVLRVVMIVRKIAESQAFQFWGITSQETADSIHQIELGLIRTQKPMDSMSGYWGDVSNSTLETIDNLASMPTPLEEIDGLFAAIDQKMKDNNKQQTDLNNKLKEQGKIQQSNKLEGTPGLRLETATLKAELDNQQKNMKAYYAEGKAGLERYYLERDQTLRAHLEAQKALLKKEIEGEENPEKRGELYLKLEEIQASYNEDSWKLEEERQKGLMEIQQQQALAWSWYGDERRTEEQIALEAETKQIEDEYQYRLSNLEELLANELITEEEFAKRREEMRAFYENRAARVREKESDMWITRVKSNATMAQEAFSNLYEMTGKKVRAFFYLQKAAAIAETMISTYEGAQKAYTSMAGIPYVGPGLGVAMAAIAVAGGLARIAIISSQNMAKGGEVGGHSPSSTADNIPANLTAGEFVHPVSAVQYYGPGVMEAMRRQMVPREIFSQYALQARRGHTHFAAGGLAIPQPKQEQQQQVVNITNITSPDEINQYLQTKPGEETILNVVSKYSRQVRAIIAQ